MTHRNGRSAWAIKLVLDVTSAAVTCNTELLVREEQTFFFALYTNLKTRQMNSCNAVGKTGHKWKNPHILNALLVEECCSLCLHGRSDRSWPMYNLADWRKGIPCKRGINGRKFLSPHSHTPTPHPHPCVRPCATTIAVQETRSQPSAWKFQRPKC
jgi:hypothetical protein